MEILNGFSFGLLIWQLLVLVLLITIIYFVVKLYKKLIVFLDKNKKS